MWFHMAVGDCDTLTDTWATLTLPYWTDKKKDSKIQTSDPLLHTQSCTVTWVTWRGNPLMMYLWLTSYASLWRGKQVLLSVEEEQRGSEAQQCRKKASWGDTSGEPVETSADSKVFLMSLHHRAKRCPGVRIRTKTKFEKKQIYIYSREAVSTRPVAGMLTSVPTFFEGYTLILLCTIHIWKGAVSFWPVMSAVTVARWGSVRGQKSPPSLLFPQAL